MKKIFLIALTVLGLSTLVSCEEFGEDWIVDWSPVKILIEVHDKDGNDLLDPDNPNNLIKGTTINYRGETLEVNTSILEYDRETYYAKTRAYAPEFRGLYLALKNWYQDDGEGYILCLGEIDGAVNMDEDFVITWADGTQNTIHYHCSDHKEGKHPTCTRWYKLDGKKQDDNRFVLTK